MYRMALVETGVVVNTIIAADTSDFPGWIDVTDHLDGLVSIGWTWDGVNFAPPAYVPPVVDPIKSYTLAQWIDALTDDELGVILEYVNSTATTAAARKARKVWSRWQAHDRVDFHDQVTVDAVTWLVANTAEWTPARGQELSGIT